MSNLEGIIASMPEEYERYLIAAIDSNMDLWSTASAVICIDPKTRTADNQFSVIAHYAIYKAICEWKTTCASIRDNLEERTSKAIVETYLKYFAAQSIAIIQESQIEEILSIYDKILAIPAADALAVVSSNWRQWVANSYTSNRIRDIKRTGEVNVAAAVHDITVQVNESILVDLTDDETTCEFGDGIFRKEETVERIPLGRRFKGLNDCLGGGLGKKEHIMFIAPTGQGKTIIATQLAADVAYNGKHVVFISTEQHSDELEPRIISNLAEIPFEIIKDGGDYSKILTEPQAQAASNAIDNLRGYLHFDNWMGKGLSVRTDLEAIVQKRIAKYGTIDVLILDWIGGALVGGQTDPGIIRRMYLDAAATMKNIAVKYNISCISLAQATADAFDKVKVTEKHIAECKTLHQECTAGFGISALRAKDIDGENADSYLQDQYCYCFKSRKAAGKMIKIKRNFGLQRFENM